MNKREKALAILQAYRPDGDYCYLGEGSEGIVYRDDQWIYKIYYSLTESKLSYLKKFIEFPCESIYLYKIKDIIAFNDVHILIYPYEESLPVTELNEGDFWGFLPEMWQRKLIFRNVKPQNFIRVNGVLKLIDYEFEPYTDSLFLNMCVRTFICIKYAEQEQAIINKIARSAINNFDLPELNGIQDFTNKVFSTIILNESQAVREIYSYSEEVQNDKTIEIPFNQLQNIESLFYASLSKGLYLRQFEIKNIKLNSFNHFEPEFVRLYYSHVKLFRKTVTLIIKTCPQDYETIYANVKHIVNQLSSPDTFLEKIISIDVREHNFLREFTAKGTLEKLLTQVSTLIEEQIIDRYIMLNPDEVSVVNYRWFGIKSNATHSNEGAPVTSQLYAFDQANGEYILQTDSDVMIARKDFSHSFLEDMVVEMEKNDKVVSVGFNICQNSKIHFKPYFGFEDGGFVPEVRMGLFHKPRLYSLLPLPNQSDDSGNWKQTWFRLLHQKQKETGYCSIRGGDSRSFFIHPQNYRKANPDIWTTILDRIESGCIPICQQDKFDCAGSYYDWTIPKRNEDLVIVCLVRNVEYPRFLKMFCSVASQQYDNWGMIIIDDASTNGLPLFIENIIKPYSPKITFVKNRVRQGSMANHYKAIHYFVSNPESIIMTIDGDDAIIGKDVFEQVVSKYLNERADVVIGRMYQTYRLQAHYRYPADFIHPRITGGNVWQHLRSFKKYIFDSLDINDLKINTIQDNYPLRKLISNTWVEDCSDYAMMVPIIEMSSNPMQLDYMTYYHERFPYDVQTQKLKEKCIADILNREVKNTSVVFKGRKRFLPNLNKIEIDITYECNLKCVACNRSCSQAPTHEKMDMSNIEDFVNESITQKKKWELINILGGEPTLHPHFEDIIRYITETYIIPYSEKTILQIVSNGLTLETKDILENVKRYRNVFIDYNSFKTSSKIEYFSPFNDAPMDDEQFNNSDYTKACWVTSYCGIGLNKAGYYGCAVCGGIDRVLHRDRGGIRYLKDISTDKFQIQFSKFCRYCGNFKDYDINKGNFIPRCEKAPFNKNIISNSWEGLY
ncbi:molybdenum cofactor biosynthesis protein A [Bacteroidales bacterium Barb7]|nr:molybdenum cofactor biosynthesis protein A [Bacteroidales bacterium Barb7]